MEPNVIYRHTQIGYTSLALIFPLLLGVLFVLFFGEPALPMKIVFSIITIPCLLISLFLYGLTITVDNQYLSWHFGLKSFSKKIKLENIKGVEVVDDTKAFGYGMRFTQRGTLYNVSGKRAVAIRLETPWKKDKEILLGTDRPDELQLVLQACIDKRRKLLEAQPSESLFLADNPKVARR
ncbi:MAG: hypothetical protein AB8G77_12855 [Rhodothermales bacterium]